MLALPTLFILFNVLIFIVAVSVAAFVLPFRKWGRTKWLLLFLVALCLISFATLNVYVQNDFQTRVLFSRLRFVGLALLAPSWLIFLSCSFQTWQWLQNKSSLIILFGPAAITILFSVISPFQNLVVYDFLPIDVFGLSVVTYKGGLWFPIHYLSSVIIILMSFALGIVIYIKRPGVQKKQIVILMAGSLASLICDIYCVITGSPLRWAMLPAGTYLLTEVAIAYGVFQYRFLAAAVSDLQTVYLEHPDAVFIIDEQEKIVSFNRSASWFFRITETSIGSSLTQVVSLPTAAASEVELSNLDGTSRIFECRKQSVSKNSDYPGQIIFLKDVTIQRQNERRSVEEARFRSRLMSLIAHDMFGHVSSQTQLLESLQKNELSFSGQQASQILIESSRSSRDLMANLLSWAKSQDHFFQLTSNAFEINVLIEDITEELTSLFDHKNVLLSFTRLMEPWVVNGDSQMIATIVRNLLTNALRASKPGQSVTITVEKDINSYSVSIQDEGIGMSTAQVQRLYEIDNNLPNVSANEKNGFGIGFTFVRQFVSLHGGTLKVDSVLNKGTCICFTIPL